MTGANDAVEMYKSIMGCSPSVNVEDFYHTKEIYNRGKLVYEYFGEHIGSCAGNAELNSVSPKALFRWMQEDMALVSYKANHPYLDSEKYYDDASITDFIRRTWSYLGKGGDISCLGKITRFMIAEALSEVGRSVTLQYNIAHIYTEPLFDVTFHNVFSIMANRDTYIQVISLQDREENYYIYSRSKVDEVELFFKDVAPCSANEKDLRGVKIKAIDRHFQRFVEGVIELYNK